jgi:23S rRNA (guanosine2251-2'-O)-methyltransferase
LQALYGWHTVLEALRNPRRVTRRLVTTENAAIRLREALGTALPTEPVIAKAEDIGRQLTPDAVHQGLLLIAEPLVSPALDEMEATGIVLALDQVTDPHNVGAILRSAAAFGVSAVITTERHSPEVTGVLAKAASGALEHVPLVTVRNLARALDDLKQRGLVLVGLDSDGDADIAALPLRRPLALVLGAEGKGLRQLTRQTCHHVARLELPGRIVSLNVSNAAAVALYVAASRAV